MPPDFKVGGKVLIEHTITQVNNGIVTVSRQMYSKYGHPLPGSVNKQYLFTVEKSIVGYKPPDDDEPV
jgi:hypothetical protein